MVLGLSASTAPAEASASRIRPHATPTRTPLATQTPAPTKTPQPTAVSTSSPTPTATPVPTGTPPAQTATAVPTQVSGGPMLGGCPVLPADNIWNTRIDSLPVSPMSGQLHRQHRRQRRTPSRLRHRLERRAERDSVRRRARARSRRVPVSFTYDDESDPGPYPIPTNAPIEGGPALNRRPPRAGGRQRRVQAVRAVRGLSERRRQLERGSGAVYPLSSDALRPAGWTSADAAGLPILPGLIRYDEVAAGRIAHALRFTAAVTRKPTSGRRATSPPATPAPPCRRWALACGSRPASISRTSARPTRSSCRRSRRTACFWPTTAATGT